MNVHKIHSLRKIKKEFARRYCFYVNITILTKQGKRVHRQPPAHFMKRVMTNAQFAKKYGFVYKKK